MAFCFKKRKPLLIFKQYNWFNSKTITLCSFHRFVLLVCLRFRVAGLTMNEIVSCWPVNDVCSFSSLRGAIPLKVFVLGTIITLWFIFSSRSREEMIREQILQSEMRVASQMGLPSTRLLGTTLLGTGSSRLGLNNTIQLSPNKYSGRGDNFNSMNLLGSLGFTSPVQQDRLNNSLSPDNSLKDDDSHSHQLYHDWIICNKISLQLILCVFIYRKILSVIFDLFSYCNKEIFLHKPDQHPLMYKCKLIE